MFTILNKLISGNMAILSVAAAVFAYCFHGSFTEWVNNPDFCGQAITITALLVVIMFGMGLTVRPKDFLMVMTHPKQILLGELAQFMIMPFLGFTLSYLFRLPPELAVGVILVGCCPGGTSSNVMTYMAKGNVPLSIGLTCVSTVLAPIVTPLLTGFYIYLYSDSASSMDIDLYGMFLGITKIVIAPITIGLAVNKLFRNFSRRLAGILPSISCIAICIIIGYVIDANHAKLFSHGLMIFLVVVLHNMLGYALGYALGRMTKADDQTCNTLSIEVGMQNSGLASGLAQTFFADLPAATIPGALFSAWHNISGALIASYMAKRSEKKNH